MSNDPVAGSKVTLILNSIGFKVPSFNGMGHFPSTTPCKASLALSNTCAGSAFIILSNSF